MRAGTMPGELPQGTGREVAGVVDEIGAGVTDAASGDRVFGFAAGGGGAAELALRLADRGYILESGRTILTGPSAELLQSAEVRRIFLGDLAL